MKAADPEIAGTAPAACAVISSSPPMAREPIRLRRIAMRTVGQVFRLRGHPILPTFPQPTLARGYSGHQREIVTRYGGATALDLFAEANARGSLFFPTAQSMRQPGHLTV